ncbi:MAG: hypothetical protein KF830_11310 [Planctomycetes bacterium]|nr:hypothetical protein [Planctomycetota bacterium]
MASPPRIRLLLSCLWLAAVGGAQATPDSAARKIVVHDTGGHWPGAISVHADGSLWAIGNPWLGGGMRALAIGGANDLARVDGLTPGSNETVAVVGAQGVVMLRWNPATLAFDQNAWPHVQLQGARAVRTVPFGNQHLVAVLGASGRTVHCYRYHEGGSGLLVAQSTATEEVLDFAAFRHGNGTARLLRATASGLACLPAGGAVQWTLAGQHGHVLRCDHPIVKAAWLYRDANTGEWRLAQIGDAGVLDDESLAAHLGGSEQVLAAFLLDCDADGDLDLVAKTSLGVRVLLQPELPGLAQTTEVSFEPLTGTVCVPDLALMHAGTRVRVVDDLGVGDVRWSNLAMGIQPWDDGIDLHGGGQIDTLPTDDSRIHFVVSIAPEWLVRFSHPERRTYLQVITWRQAQPSIDGRLDATSESNMVHEMIDIPASVSTSTLWPLDVTLAPPWYPIGWSTDEHYWLTIRLVATEVGGSELDVVSDPVTLVTSLSIAQRDAEEPWAFVLEYSEPGTQASELPAVVAPPPAAPDMQLGGYVIGVIGRIRALPPPPPPGGIPAPSEGSTGAVSQRIPQ